MKTKIKNMLIEAIDDWLLKVAESGDDMDSRPDLIHEEMAEQMATAAEAVYDACRDSQEYYKHENPPE